MEEIFNYNKNDQRWFLVPSEGDKGKSEPKPEKSIVERTKLRRESIAEIKREEKNINNKLFDYYFVYSNPSNICNRLINVTGETKNQSDRYYQQTTKNDKLKSEENEKIIDVAEKILGSDRQKQGQGLKLLTPNQMLVDYQLF